MRIKQGDPLLHDGTLLFPKKSIEKLKEIADSEALQKISNLIHMNSSNQHKFHQDIIYDVFTTDNIEEGLDTCEILLKTVPSENNADVEAVKSYLNALLCFKIIFGLFFNSKVDDSVRERLLEKCIIFFEKIQIRNPRDYLFPSLLNLLRYLKKSKTQWIIFFSLAVIYLINYLQQRILIKDLKEFRQFLKLINGKKLINLNSPHLGLDALVIRYKN